MFDLTVNQIRVLSSLLEREMYGYEIIKEVEKRFYHRLVLGSLYNLLKSLEKNKMVKSYWSNEETSGGRRKYFQITALGESVLEENQTKLVYLITNNL